MKRMTRKSDDVQFIDYWRLNIYRQSLTLVECPRVCQMSQQVNHLCVNSQTCLLLLQINLKLLELLVSLLFFNQQSNFFQLNLGHGLLMLLCAFNSCLFYHSNFFCCSGSTLFDVLIGLKFPSSSHSEGAGCLT
jgi:hypothetical protein